MLELNYFTFSMIINKIKFIMYRQFVEESRKREADSKEREITTLNKSFVSPSKFIPMSIF